MTDTPKEVANRVFDRSITTLDSVSLPISGACKLDEVYKRLIHVKLTTYILVLVLYSVQSQLSMRTLNHEGFLRRLTWQMLGPRFLIYEATQHRVVRNNNCFASLSAPY